MVGLTERIISLERQSEGQSNHELAQKQNTDIASFGTTIRTLRTQLERQQGKKAGGVVGSLAEIEGNTKVFDNSLSHFSVYFAHLS